MKRSYVFHTVTLPVGEFSFHVATEQAPDAKIFYAVWLTHNDVWAAGSDLVCTPMQAFTKMTNSWIGAHSTSPDEVWQAFEDAQQKLHALFPGKQ